MKVGKICVYIGRKDATFINDLLREIQSVWWNIELDYIYPASTGFEVIRVACLSRSWFLYAAWKPLRKTARDLLLHLLEDMQERNLWSQGTKKPLTVQI